LCSTCRKIAVMSGVKFAVYVSNVARRDLGKIYAYIALELHEPVIAEAQLQRLKMGIESLNCLPERFSCYRSESFHSVLVRLMHIDNYVVLYTVNKKDMTVNILRSIYARCDITGLMSQMNEKNKEI